MIQPPTPTKPLELTQAEHHLLATLLTSFSKAITGQDAREMHKMLTIYLKNLGAVGLSDLIIKMSNHLEAYD